MSQTPQNSFLIGLFMVGTTVIFWGILPIALIFALTLQDGVTITWFRFLVAAIVCAGIQGARGKLREFHSLNKREWGALSLAAIFLIGDYVLYIYGLTFIDASAMQVFSQTMPLFMALAGVVFFAERLTKLQGLCFVGLFTGLVLFFNASISEFELGETKFLIGAAIAVFATFIWTIYAVLQKKLAGRLSSANTLLFIYIVAIFCLLPAADLTSFTSLSSANWAILAFCAANTLIAYTAFSESLKYWPTTHIGSVVAATPLMTIFAAYVGHQMWPDTILFTSVNTLGWFGVALTLVSMIVFNLRPNKKTA